MLNIDCEVEFLAEAAQFYAAALEISHYPVDVEIVLLDNADLDGYCGELDKGDYEIGVKANGVDTLVILAHEFVHLYQYVTGAMRPLDANRILYLDKVYHYDMDDPAHLDFPFEQEAYAKEQGLMLAFISWYAKERKFQ